MSELREKFISEDDLMGFRFMLTEEFREKSLLRRRRSSMETDEQLLQYLNAKRPSELEECDNFLKKKNLMKIMESEDSEDAKGGCQFRLLGEINENEKINQSSEQKVGEEEYCFPPVVYIWDDDSSEKEKEKLSDTDKTKKEDCKPPPFFLELKSDESRPKSPIYRNINDVYEFKSRLKLGTYTIVNKYFNKLREIDVAIKIIPKIGIPDKRFFKFVPRELDLAQEKTLRHPNIVQFLETYEIGLRIYIMMEFVEEGNLSDFIKARGRLDPVTYRSFFHQLITAVNFCLDYGICHRKLSTDNCLVSSKYVLKLCDFSFSRHIQDRNELLDTFCGVLGFTAPEILMCREYRPNMTESWSCGVILFTMVYGAMPFDSSNFARLLRQVLKPIKYHWYCDTPIDAIMIMYQSISPINRRWSVRQILGHRWVSPPPTKGYENYMKWYKKRTRGPTVSVVRKKLIELMELIKRDYVTPLNEKQEQLHQGSGEEGSEQEKTIGQNLKERMRLCELEI